MGMFAPLNSVVLNGNAFGLTARAAAVALCLAEAQTVSTLDYRAEAYAVAEQTSEAITTAYMDGVAVATADNHVHQFFVTTPAPLDPAYPANAEASLTAEVTHDVTAGGVAQAEVYRADLVLDVWFSADDLVATASSEVQGLGERPFWGGAVAVSDTPDGYFFRGVRFTRTVNAVAQASLSADYVYVSRARAQLMAGEAIGRVSAWGVHTHALLQVGVEDAAFGEAEVPAFDFIRHRQFVGTTLAEGVVDLDPGYVWLDHGVRGLVFGDAISVSSPDVVRDGVRYTDATTLFEAEAELVVGGPTRLAKLWELTEAEAYVPAYEYERFIHFAGTAAAVVATEAYIIIVPIGGVIHAVGEVECDPIRYALFDTTSAGEVFALPVEAVREAMVTAIEVAEAQVEPAQLDRAAAVWGEIEASAELPLVVLDRDAPVWSEVEATAEIESEFTRLAFVGGEIEAVADAQADLILLAWIEVDVVAEAVITRARLGRLVWPMMRDGTIGKSLVTAELDVLPPVKDGLAQARAIAEGYASQIAFVSGETMMGAAATIPTFHMRKYTYMPVGEVEAEAGTDLNTLLNNYFPASKHRKLFIEAENRSLPIAHQDRTYIL